MMSAPFRGHALRRRIDGAPEEPWAGPLGPTRTKSRSGAVANGLQGKTRCHKGATN